MARVLIVEDHLDAARLFEIFLQSEGHETRIAHDGPAALDLFDAFQPHFVFLDITLPGMDGCELAMKLNSRATAIKPYIAALTGWGELDVEQLRASGIDLYLLKPVDLDAVRRIVDPLTQSQH